MTVLLLVLAGLILLVTALLAVPMDLSLHVTRDEAWQGDAYMRWLFGLVSTRIESKGEREDKKPKKEKTKVRRRRAGTGRKVYAMLTSPGFVGRVLRFVRHVLRTIHVHTFDLDAKVGLDDPADTGKLWGLMGPLPYMIPLPRRSRVYIEPDFDQERLSVDLDADVRVFPIEVVFRTVQLALSPKTLRALFAAARA